MPAVSCAAPFIALSMLVVPQRIEDGLQQDQGTSRLPRMLKHYRHPIARTVDAAAAPMERLFGDPSRDDSVP